MWQIRHEYNTKQLDITIRCGMLDMAIYQAIRHGNVQSN